VCYFSTINICIIFPARIFAISISIRNCIRYRILDVQFLKIVWDIRCRINIGTHTTSNTPVTNKSTLHNFEPFCLEKQYLDIQRCSRVSYAQFPRFSSCISIEMIIGYDDGHYVLMRDYEQPAIMANRDTKLD